MDKNSNRPLPKVPYIAGIPPEKLKKKIKQLFKNVDNANFRKILYLA